EWLPSLPLHYMLYKAFGWEETQPRFAHLSLLLKPDGKGKLSKRDGDKLGFPVFPLRWVNPAGEVSRGYREDGYFPEAFVNLLALLGWNPGDDREMFTIDELIPAFSLDRIVKSGARFNPEKARWYNKEYLRLKSDEELAALFIPVLESHGLKVVDAAAAEADFKAHVYTKDYVLKVVRLIKERATFVADFWTIASYLFIAPSEFEAFGVKAGAAVEQKPEDPRRAADPRAKVYDDAATAPFLAKDVDKFWKPENYELAVKAAEFVTGSDFSLEKEVLESKLEEYIKGNEWPMGKVMNCLRLALAGASSGLGIADIVSLIGREELASRISYICNRL
ncbi:MAG: hypothetical protein IKT11_07325, partial [Bacteroidales bacterium]|nr:hypothetical protein [Bacteroidales bacterium]